jgi:ABC-2 type transport system ATP-binding protein
MAYAVEITALTKRYHQSWSPALDNFSILIEENKIYGLLGPNGAGKTTCISILCGLIKPDSGTVRIYGADAIAQSNKIRTMIGLVPQQIALFGNLTAWENFLYIGRLYGIADATIKERTHQLLARLDLAKHAHKKTQSFSGGMKRRANIIASLLHEPRLLILDEPTAGVDVQSRAMILQFLEEYRSQGKTILYTSHLLNEAEQICDEVVIIDEGKYIVHGTSAQLIQQTPSCKKLEDVFLHFTGHEVRD